MLLPPFKIIGITIRTTNAKAMTDLGRLWENFYKEDILSKIPNKVSHDIYSIYTDYKSNHTDEYTCIIGCKVESIDTIPTGLTGKEFTGGKYQLHQAKGKIPDAVVQQWQEIWQKEELIRKYTADFEVYSQKSQNSDDAEVDIYIAIK